MMKRAGLPFLAVLLLVAPPSVAAQESARIPYRLDSFASETGPPYLPSCGAPPQSSVALQIAGGAGAGILAIGAGAAAILILASGRYLVSGGGQSTDLDALVTVVAYPSYVLGSAAGVYWIGHRRGHRGRFLPTLLGSALGLGSPGATLGYHLSDSSPAVRSGVLTRHDFGCAAEGVRKSGS